MTYRLFLSSTLLTQADRVSPTFAAARSYRAFRSSLMRMVRYSRSPLLTAGLPLGRFGSSAIGELCTNKIILAKCDSRVFNVGTFMEAVMTHKLKKIRAGAIYSESVYEYRGFTVRGHPPRHGWGGGGWTWYAERGEVRTNGFSRKEVVEKIDRLILRELGGAA